MRTLTLLILLCLTGCAPGTDRSTDAPADTSASAPGASSVQDAPGPAALRTEADARRVLRAVYRPLHAFYQRMDTTGPGPARPPEGMATPAALIDTLTQTMAPEQARAFAGQLLMKRDNDYIVRPTERILTLYESTPALEGVEITRGERGRYILTERYAPSELYGRVERQNVLRRDDGRWRLVDIR